MSWLRLQNSLRMSHLIMRPYKRSLAIAGRSSHYERTLFTLCINSHRTFLHVKASSNIFASGQGEVHRVLFARSLQVMSVSNLTYKFWQTEARWRWSKAHLIDPISFVILGWNMLSSDLSLLQTGDDRPRSDEKTRVIPPDLLEMHILQLLSFSQQLRPSSYKLWVPQNARNAFSPPCDAERLQHRCPAMMRLIFLTPPFTSNLLKDAMAMVGNKSFPYWLRIVRSMKTSSVGHEEFNSCKTPPERWHCLPLRERP